MSGSERHPPTAALVVAIDGPAGSGKSSVSREVARRLGLAYLDTGAMYRAIAWAVLDRGVDPGDPGAVHSVADGIDLVIGTDPVGSRVMVDGVDVTEEIRSEVVTGAVSAVSALPKVRARLVELQREMVGRVPRGIVVEGRDIGTVVLPDAEVKVYLTASSGVRAVRRAAQDERERNQSRSVADTEAALINRDALDSTRALSPLSVAEDAHRIDSSALGFDDVVERVLDLVRRAG